MTRQYLLTSRYYSAVVDDPPSIDGMIRTNLVKAFPLPMQGGSNDEKFERLLDALSQLGQDRASDSHV